MNFENSVKRNSVCVLNKSCCHELISQNLFSSKISKYFNELIKKLQSAIFKDFPIIGNCDIFVKKSAAWQITLENKNILMESAGYRDWDTATLGTTTLSIMTISISKKVSLYWSWCLVLDYAGEKLFTNFLKSTFIIMLPYH